MRPASVSAIINLLEPAAALAPLTAARPVGMLPFGGRYRLIDFRLSSIVNAGIKNVLVTLPRSGRSVADHLRSGHDWNLNTIQGGLFLSPYNDLKLIAPEKKLALIHHYYDDSIVFLKRSHSEYTVVMSTRNVGNIDLKALLRYHQERDSAITAVYKRIAPDQLVAPNTVLSLTATGLATAVVPLKQVQWQPTEAVAKSMAVYLLSTVDLIDLLQAANQRGDLVNLEQLMRQAVAQNQTNAFEYTGFQANIHDLHSYFAANLALLDDANFRALFESSRRIYTKTHNEIPTYFADGARCHNCLCGPGGTIAGQVRHSVLARNVSVAAGAVVTNAVIMAGSRVGAGSQLTNVIVDKDAVIGPNLILKGTPKQPLVIQKGQQVFQQTEVMSRD
ncbi:glucose-1-phosphate adenylyltransferase subunit GlgD [Lactiplantibacillus modestisalitolerans]|uniref:Glucose-1-phosphate adenylyltransferase subunit GlgD n=1 Tax=Lactiplantibacillus modestisalitolerans TaxID=1457219 RepID=A0ABV5WSI5_9LACO|nr:glucose-1-phosphate adenylyltransferase subunit GlgD [Lactiplantibacillus modestisalitolerans]